MAGSDTVQPFPNALSDLATNDSRMNRTHVLLGLHIPWCKLNFSFCVARGRLNFLSDSRIVSMDDISTMVIEGALSEVGMYW